MLKNIKGEDILIYPMHTQYSFIEKIFQIKMYPLLSAEKKSKGSPWARHCWWAYISANFTKGVPSTQMHFSQIRLNPRITVIISTMMGNPAHFRASWKLPGLRLYKYKWERGVKGKAEPRGIPSNERRNNKSASETKLLTDPVSAFPQLFMQDTVKEHPSKEFQKEGWKAVLGPECRVFRSL